MNTILFSLSAETVQLNEQRSDAEAGGVSPAASHSNNFLRWFRPFSVTTTTSRASHEMTGCNHHHGVTEQAMSVHESGSRMNRNRNWFRRAATLVAGPGPLRQQQQHRLTAPVLTTPSTPWTTVQSSSLHHVVTSNGNNNVIDNIPTTDHVTTTQPQSAWKPEPSTPSAPPEPEAQLQQQQQPMTMSSNSRRQRIFSYQHTRSYDNDDDENEETISENLNSAINSLLDFQTADLEAVVPTVGCYREGASAVTAGDDERYREY